MYNLYEDPYRKRWLEQMSPSVLGRVSQQPAGRQRTWLGRGDVRAAHVARRGEMLDRMTAPARQRMEFIQSQMPLGDREKLALTNEQQMRMLMMKNVLDTQSADVGYERDLRKMTIGRGHELEDIASRQGFDVDMTLLREGLTRGRPERYAPQAFMGPQGDAQWVTPGQPIPQGYGPARTPQFDVFQNTITGQQQYIPEGGNIPAGMQLTSPNKFEINFGPTERPSPTERTEIRDARTSIDMLDNLKSLVDSSYVGPIQGRLGPVSGLFGMTSQGQEEFYAASAAFKNMIIKQITGAQMSELEARRILAQVPKPEDPYHRWLANWTQSRNNVAMLLQRQQEILRQSGMIVPGETPLPWQQQNELNTLSNEQLINMLRQAQ